MQVINQSHEILTSIDRVQLYKLIELSGRTAYKSEDKITENSAEKFIKNIIVLGHESVLEHGNISVKFITDRGVTHELVRHRLCAYTQESTRYCNYSKKGMTFIQPTFWNEVDGVSSKTFNNQDMLLNWQCSMECSELAYKNLIRLGATPQEARSVLPNSLKTEIICTANIREWRHILKLRTSKAAHPQMRALMLPLLHELQDELPALFGDINI
jgi:thymidylate synthase (FAD)